MINQIEKKLEALIPLSREDAKFLYETAAEEDLIRLANQVKSRYHTTSRATYLIMAIVNYTNICVAKCDYCSFYRLPHEKDTYLLSFEEVCQKIDQLICYGGTLVSFNGGFHPKLKLSDYAELFSRVHQKYPQLTFFEMTIAEFMFACKRSKISYEEGAELLKRSGTRWVTGGGAEVLDEAFRKRHSPGKFTVADYFDAQKEILKSGIGSTATMVVGFDESLDERLNHLEKLRLFQKTMIQEYNRPLPSFLCWTFKPSSNQLGTELGQMEMTSQEYKRWLAICRIYLHNFKHIRTSVLTQNEEALGGLMYGADDFDLPTEDEVTQKAGATISLDFERILQRGRDLGYEIVHRPPFK